MDVPHRKLLRNPKTKSSSTGDLSVRRRETLELLLKAKTERQIALHMGISVHTVHMHVKHIYAHFGVNSRTELLVKLLTAKSSKDNENNEFSPTPVVHGGAGGRVRREPRA